MGAQAGGESFPLYLYDNGVTSNVVGGWNTTGYKYGSAFAQSEQSAALRLYATSKYNATGGRTYTSNNIVPDRFIGKSLHVKGYFKMNGDLAGGRDSYAYVFISESVQDASATQEVLSSGAFTNEIHQSSLAVPGTGQIQPGESKSFEMVLPITQAGYLSFAFYKGYTGLLYLYIQEAWIK